MRDASVGLPRLAAARGDVAVARVGPRRIVLVNEPTAIRDVLVGTAGTFTKGGSLRGLRTLLGEGLITSDGEAHARQRRALRGHFGQAHATMWVTRITEAARSRTARWQPGEVLDLEAEMLALSLDVTLRTLFHGERSHAELDRVQVAVAVMNELSTLASLPGLRLWARMPLPPVLRFRRARDDVRDWARVLVEERRQQAEPPADVLDAILRSSGATADDALGGAIDQVVTILVAAHVTTGHALGRAVDCLARDPVAAEALAAEATDAQARGSMLDARHLPYGRAVFAEALRLFPPAWVIGRQAGGPTDLGGTRIHGSDLVLASPFVTHRDPRWFDRPDEFWPERWLADDGPSRINYFPFGLGARRCPGEALAWTEGVLVLALLASAWRFEPLTARPAGLRSGITLSARGGLPIRVHRRPS